MREEQLKVLSNQQIAHDVYEMQFDMPKNIVFKSGQFIHLATPNSRHLLRRPFAIADFSEKSFSICYQVKGSGTQSFVDVKAGDMLAAVLPLGNYFKVEKAYKKVAIVGGGVGVFPLLAFLNEYKTKVDIYSYIGFRSAQNACKMQEFTQNAKRAIFTTDDGSFAQKGNIVDIFMQDIHDGFDAVYACGPTPMLVALKERFLKDSLALPCFVSLEERMGCGVGACLVCVCKQANGDKNFRVCKDGPIFNLQEVEL